MRIVSLLPAATEWICALGAEADLVGRSHECDYPPSVQSLPVLTQPSFPNEGSSLGIDHRVRERVQQGLSLYDVDLEHLRALRPDLIVTQAQCAVCAVSMPQLEAALATWTGATPEVFSIEPYTLRQVLDVGLHLGKTLGRLDAMMQYLGDGEGRIGALRRRLGIHKRSDPLRWPTVACIEWLEPLMIAGHWMPDIVAMAGGQAVLAQSGLRSDYVFWEAVCVADPDVLAVTACGFTLGRTRREIACLTNKEGWNDLKAVQEGRVVLFDGNAYFNRPGPRLYRSIELMAVALHPDRMAGYEVEDGEMERYLDG